MLLNILFSGLLQLTWTPLLGIKMENFFALTFNYPTLSYISEKYLVLTLMIISLFFWYHCCLNYYVLRFIFFQPETFIAHPCPLEDPGGIWYTALISKTSLISSDFIVLGSY